MESSPIGFAHRLIGRRIAPHLPGERDFLMKAVRHRVKEKEEVQPKIGDKPKKEKTAAQKAMAGMSRLGPSGCLMMASEEDSILVAPLVGVASVDKFRVIDKELLPDGESVELIEGRWLWSVKTPFLYGEQGKGYVIDALSLSKSLRGGRFCSPSGVDAFDLVLCRDLALKIAEMGAVKAYREYASLIQKRDELSLGDAKTQELLRDVTKKISKLDEKYPGLKCLRLPRPRSMESDVLRKLLAAWEVDHA